MKRRSFFIPANACWLNSLANQEVYILNHQNIIYEHTMKLKCEMCPQDATFVVGCGNKTACLDNVPNSTWKHKPPFWTTYPNQFGG